MNARATVQTVHHPLTPAVAGIHLVTDDRLPFARTREIVAAAVAEGVAVVQLRVKNSSARELLEQTGELSAVIGGRAVFLVDDRVDIVLAARDAGARVDGVHLGQGDLPVEAARRLLGASSIIGWTANRPEHFAAAAAMPHGTVDYFGVGAIRPTTTKADPPPVIGVAGFAALAARTTLPCVAIGGLTAADAAALRDSGAAGVAVISAVSAAADPGLAARELCAAFAPAAVAR